MPTQEPRSIEEGWPDELVVWSEDAGAHGPCSLAKRPSRAHVPRAPRLSNARHQKLALLGGLAALLIPARAHGFDAQWHAGAGLGGVNASPASLGLGVGVNAYASYGLNDMFDLKLDFAASSHALTLSGNQERHGIYDVVLGLSYKIDIIEWIPYFGIGAGYMFSDLPQGVGIEPNDILLGGMIGLDYAMSREFGIGIANRLHAAVRGGSLVDLFLRAEYRWGW